MFHRLVIFTHTSTRYSIDSSKCFRNVYFLYGRNANLFISLYCTVHVMTVG
jgi:hypothetical protein